MNRAILAVIVIGLAHWSQSAGAGISLQPTAPPGPTAKSSSPFGGVKLTPTPPPPVKTNPPAVKPPEPPPTKTVSRQLGVVNVLKDNSGKALAIRLLDPGYDIVLDEFSKSLAAMDGQRIGLNGSFCRQDNKRCFAVKSVSAATNEPPSDTRIAGTVSLFKDDAGQVEAIRLLGASYDVVPDKFSQTLVAMDGQTVRVDGTCWAQDNQNYLTVKSVEPAQEDKLDDSLPLRESRKSGLLSVVRDNSGKVTSIKLITKIYDIVMDEASKPLENMDGRHVRVRYNKLEAQDDKYYLTLKRVEAETDPKAAGLSPAPKENIRTGTVKLYKDKTGVVQVIRLTAEQYEIALDEAGKQFENMDGRKVTLTGTLKSDGDRLLFQINPAKIDKP